MRFRRARAPLLLALGALLAGPAPPAAGEPEGPRRAWVALGGETFSLEIAADARSRWRGLSGRSAIAPGGGMLFVLPRPEPLTMVMRDCPVAIDVAFLDGAGEVVAIHEMQPEPPRRADETPHGYERRLRPYRSGEPVHFAIETAGGRLRQVGLAVGDRVALDAEALATLARQGVTPGEEGQKP